MKRDTAIPSGGHRTHSRRPHSSYNTVEGGDVRLNFKMEREFQAATELEKTQRKNIPSMVLSRVDLRVESIPSSVAAFAPPRPP